VTAEAIELHSHEVRDTGQAGKIPPAPDRHLDTSTPRHLDTSTPRHLDDHESPFVVA
jgi:hypothetical protein